MSGNVVSHDKILEHLAVGRMGAVAKVQDLTLGRPVALKSLSSSLIRDTEARRQFVQEANAALPLQCNGTCVAFVVDEPANIMLPRDRVTAMTRSAYVPDPA